MTVATDVLVRPAVPSRAGAAIQVLALIDDPDSRAADLARVIGSDPAFTTRVLLLANSAYYGLGGRVGTLQYGVSVLGYQTIRALAVTIAAGLDGPDAAPEGYWEQAALSATAATSIAPLLGGSAPDAFCVGLLHTLGSALLHQHHPLPQLCLPETEGIDELDQRETDLYGVGHAAAGAQVLASWHFPHRLCELIATHHDAPLPDASPDARTLHAARALTDLALNPQADAMQAHDTIQRVSEGRITSAHVQTLVPQIAEQAEFLLTGLRPN
jgi:HD-like signal output (HDOD) protein